MCVCVCVTRRAATVTAPDTKTAQQNLLDHPEYHYNDDLSHNTLCGKTARASAPASTCLHKTDFSTKHTFSKLIAASFPLLPKIHHPCTPLDGGALFKGSRTCSDRGDLLSLPRPLTTPLFSRLSHAPLSPTPSSFFLASVLLPPSKNDFFLFRRKK